MHTLEVALGSRAYPIHVGAGLLQDRELVGRSIPARQVLVVSDTNVAPLYLDAVRAALTAADVAAEILPHGEQHKTLATFSRLIDTLIERRFHRDACVVALGGGVVGDVSGFAAASYQRGIGFVQIPTTLLAQVDSSVGGKTAVNHPQAKNMIGAFHQPSAVLADTDTLRTLAPRELKAGLAEVVKYGLILDREFFAWIDANLEHIAALDAAAMSHAIRRSCELKAVIVAEDERERGRRALLNLGHTFGHALESIGGYGRWLHGEAVAIGTVIAARVSVALGRLQPEDAQTIEDLLDRIGLPTRAADVSSEALLQAMQLDKKASAMGLKLVLLDSIGSASVAAAPAPERLRAVLDEVLAGP